MRRQSSRVVALVPLNAPSLAKTRLRSALTPYERQTLVRWVAHRVVDALTGSHVLDAIGIVSPSEDVLEWATSLGCEPIPQREGGLNDGLELGRRWALDAGAQGLLVTLGDLPLLTGDEVARLVLTGMRGDTSDHVVLAPDRHERGTNALYVRPADALPFAFGQDSLRRHRLLARERGIESELFVSPGTGFDVDTPDDLNDLIARGVWPETLARPAGESREAS